MKITVYSKPNCGACDITKQWLDSNNVPYTAIDAFEDADAMAELQSHGFMGFPVVEYKDIKFTGFDYGKLNQIISEVSDG